VSTVADAAAALHITEFVAWYGEALPRDRPLQEAFLQKLVSLCED